MTETFTDANADAAHVEREFSRLRAACEDDRYPALEARRAWLTSLERVLRANVDVITRAVSEDFGHRSPIDTKLGELWLTLSHLRYVRAHLGEWMQPRRKSPLVVLRPATAWGLPQPLGVVGIIAPWNYPLMLALTPLIGALGAGNHVMLKLSEHTPRTSELLARLLEQALPRDRVCVILGGPAMGQAVSELPFDHLLFTGAHSVGKRVAEAAAKNLVPVTLELGGKSPAILHAGFSLEKFAASVVQGKCYSAGQSCVAPDYLLVPRGLEGEVVDALRRRVARCFPTLRDNPDYTAVASPARKARLIELREEAISRGARAIELDPASESLEGTQKLALTLLLDVPPESRVQQEEIFGPLLPIVSYGTLDDALSYVNERPRPLALYYFDRDRTRQDRVLEQTHSGGVTLNDTLLHFLCDDLSRGGVGASGHGAYYGRKSFDTFSHQKSVVRQASFDAVGVFAPPYGTRIEWFIRWVLRV